MQEDAIAALFRQAEQTQNAAKVLSAEATNIYRAASELKRLVVELATQHNTIPETRSK